MGKGGSEPRRWRCVDGHDYSVKHPNNPQTDSAPQLLATEFVVARIGLAMGAPVFPCAIVDVSPELVLGLEYRSIPGRAVQPGRAFGSQIRGAGVMDAEVAPPQWKKAKENRSRAAAVCVLHALFILGDSPQFVVRRSKPYEFWSIDHGYFIAGGGPWPPGLGANATVSDIPTGLFPELKLKAEDLRAAAIPLLQLSDDQLARLIAPIPAEWLPQASRAECLQFVAERRERIGTLIAVDSK